MISPRWDLQPCDDPASERLAAVLGIAPIVARLLCQRGLGDPETAQRFLNPSLDHLHDPLLLADMRVAVDRIMAAIERKERIAIHGDYDVDGITSTVILRRALEMLGADVGVALKLVQALCRRADRDGWMPGFIKVAAIGTLADVVPLVGENRVIAKLGLDLLTRGPHKIGLRSLLDISGLTGKTIDSYHISFLLAPRVNAAGRMSTPDIATRLLLAADEAMAEEVRQLAMTLDGENLKRQEEEADILAAAKKIVQTDPDIGARSVLVVAGDGWHRGVIGIVASKLVDAFHRPAIVLSVEDGVAHGSCRSISKFDMLGALERCAHLLMRFGGHRQAAGLALEASRIKELRLAVNAVADETLGPDDLMPRLRIDGDLTFRGITGDVAYGVAALAPFGAGNPRPVFAARRVEIIDGPRKLKERHLKMALKQDGRIFRAIAWRAAERHDYLTEHKAALDVAFSLEQNQYNGETFVELTLADLRQSEV